MIAVIYSSFHQTDSMTLIYRPLVKINFTMGYFYPNFPTSSKIFFDFQIIYVPMHCVTETLRHYITHINENINTSNHPLNVLSVAFFIMQKRTD